MGNQSSNQFFYFNGLMLKPQQERACENYLKARQNVVQITGKYWEKLRLKEFLLSIDQWDIKKTLNIGKVNKFPFECLENIKFPFLINLSLQNCNIESIQCIDRIWMPSLEVLDLAKNRITSVRPLRRLNCKHLKRIYIHTNCFHDSDSLAQLPLTIEEVGISNQININWSFKSFIQFSDFSQKQENLLRTYNFRGNRSIIIFDLMINI